jgi:hypothetical protein
VAAILHFFARCLGAFSFKAEPQCNRRACRRPTVRAGNKAMLLFVLFDRRLCGPLANSLFTSVPTPQLKPLTPIRGSLS